MEQIEERCPDVSPPLIAWVGHEGASKAQFLVGWISEEPGMYQGKGPTGEGEDLQISFGRKFIPSGSGFGGNFESSSIARTDERIRKVAEELRSEGIGEKRIEGLVKREMEKVFEMEEEREDGLSNDEVEEEADCLNEDGSVRLGSLV